MTDILMPALSPTMEEGTLAKWHVKVGDKISSGDVIAEIETDKATMEVEAVDEGEIAELLIAEGTEEVKVNSVIARLAGEGGAAAPAAPEPAAAPVDPNPQPASRAEAKGDPVRAAASAPAAPAVALKAIDAEVKKIVAEAAEYARTSPEPDPSELYTDVYTEA